MEKYGESLDVVVHDPDEGEFYIDFSTDHRVKPPRAADCRAFLQYEMNGNRMIITHTEVPESLRGKGYGKVLAKAALNHVEENNYRVTSQCSFFTHFVETYEPSYLKYFKK